MIIGFMLLPAPKRGRDPVLGPPAPLCTFAFLCLNQVLRPPVDIRTGELHLAAGHQHPPPLLERQPGLCEAQMLEAVHRPYLQDAPVRQRDGVGPAHDLDIGELAHVHMDEPRAGLRTGANLQLDGEIKIKVHRKFGLETTCFSGWRKARLLKLDFS